MSVRNSFWFINRSRYCAISCGEIRASLFIVTNFSTDFSHFTHHLASRYCLARELHIVTNWSEPNSLYLWSIAPKIVIAFRKYKFHSRLTNNHLWLVNIFRSTN